MTHFAMVFPGQGSQSLGMLSELAEKYPVIQATFDEASDILNCDVWALVQSGPAEKLNQTEITQPVMLAGDVALFRCWSELGGPLPSVMAGHSLGEYSALVCAKSLSFEEALRLVANRGRYMQEAVKEGEGAMAALIGLDDGAVLEICREAAEGQVLSPANFNSVGQTVVAGAAAAVERAIALGKSKGAKLATKIPVSVPSHCALMQPAADRLKKDLSSVIIQKPQIPVVQNADVQEHTNPEDIRDTLIQQLTSPVRWVETVQYFVSEKINKAVECGPGQVLAGLIKRTTSEITAYPTSKQEWLGKAINAIKG